MQRRSVVESRGIRADRPKQNDAQYAAMIGDAAVLREQAAAWETQRNTRQKGVDWQFTTADARIKLKRLYPKIQS